MTDPDNNPRETRETRGTTTARDACMAAYRAAIEERIAACGLCDDLGRRLDSDGNPSRESCTHRPIGRAS